MSDVMLTANGASVTLHGGDFDGSGIALTGLSGWYQTPSPKITVTSRGQGDGGHDIAADDIMYEARVVTVGYRIIAGADRGEALRHLSLLDRLVHGLVTCRVIDEGQDTYCSGGYYVRSLEQKIQNPLWQNLSGDITIVFERPERLSTLAHSGEARASVVQAGGLSYGTGNAGLAYPLSYGVVSDGATVMRLPNQGTSRAYPTYALNGEWPNGCTLRLACDGLGSTLAFNHAIHTGTPVLLDTRSRTATMGGVDVTSGLSRRGWMTIPAGSALTVNLATPGSGWVTCESHDTYM